MAILLALLLSAFATVDAKTVQAQGVRFGEMTTLVETETRVYHIELDLSNPYRLMFADGSSLKLTDGIFTMTLVGSATQRGYREGTHTSARFDYIRGFSQLNTTTIIASDRYNHCLRVVDRGSYSTSTFVGQCQSKGFVDGLQALFNEPVSVILGSVRTLLLADRSNHAIRQVNIISRVTTTLIQRSVGICHPASIVFDFSHKNLLIVNRHYIGKYSMTGSFTILTGSKEEGFKNGSLSQCRMNYPRELLLLTDDIILVADDDNHRLRIVGLAQQSVSSLCTGSEATVDGPISQCSLDKPYSLLLNGSVLFIGQEEAIRVLPIELDIPWPSSCPKNMTGVIKLGQTSAPVSWTSPSGGIVSASLRAGDHDFSYRLRDGSECSFTVSIYKDDPRLKKRLDFTAQYEVKCSQIDTHSLTLKSTVNQRFTDIETICNGECKRSDNYGVRIECESDVLLVSWPTDLLLDSTTEDIPTELMTAFKPHLNSKHLLSIVIPSGVPPILYPAPNEGLIVQPVLTSVCIDGFHYDQKRRKCFSPLV